jgi:hypothetical protein
MLNDEAKKARAAFLPADPLKSASMRRATLEEWRKRFEAR